MSRLIGSAEAASALTYEAVQSLILNARGFAWEGFSPLCGEVAAKSGIWVTYQGKSRRINLYVWEQGPEPHDWHATHP